MKHNEIIITIEKTQSLRISGRFEKNPKLNADIRKISQKIEQIQQLKFL